VPQPEPVKLAKPPKAPKWKDIEPVDLEHTDEENIPDAGRPRWMIPSLASALVLILIAVVIAVSRHSSASSNAIRLGNSTVVPTAPATTNGGIVPRGGFLTQSAGGSIAPGFNGSPMAPAGAADTPDTAAQRALSQREVDSIAAIQQKLHRQIDPAPARPARPRPTQAEIDSMNTPSQYWNRAPKRDTAPPVVAPQINTPAIPPITTVKRDSAPKRDSVPKRDSIRPDTAVKR
jgi:hypothetical protein